jgi:hypothetical protein
LKTKQPPITNRRKTMNKQIKGKSLLHALLLAALTAAACTSEPAVTSAPDVQEVQSEEGNQTDTPVYWTGNGAEDVSIAVLVPEGQELAAEEAHLPLLVQGVLERDFRKFSAMEVLERAITDGESGYSVDAQYLLKGVLRKSGSNFSLQLTVRDSGSGKSRAAYTGSFPAAELENLIGIRNASADLLAQLGVRLTDEGKTALLQAEPSNCAAEILLAKGIIAWRKGAAVEALSRYYEAGKFDPGIREAARLGSALLAGLAGGNRQDAPNAIQQRNEWVRILQEAAAFFKAHPPYEIIYDPVLTQEKIDYDQETVEMSFKARIIGTIGFKVIYGLDRGLRQTGRSEDWGIGIDSIWKEIPDRYDFKAALVNEKGETMGSAAGSFEPEKNLDFRHRESMVLFTGVAVDKITDKMTVSVAGVNAGNTAEGSIGISEEDFTALEVSPFKINWRLGGIEITGYQGTDKRLVIPSKINRWPVTAVGYRAFKDKWLSRVTLPDTLIIIGDEAFSRNELTSIIIPDSVTAIGEAAFRENYLRSVDISNNVTAISYAAFRDNPLASVTIPDSVTAIGHWAFSKLISITMPANVTLDSGGSFFGFDNFYKDNGKKAGTYVQDVSGKWSMPQQ